jgi:hypothetical protein
VYRCTYDNTISFMNFKKVLDIPDFKNQDSRCLKFLAWGVNMHPVRHMCFSNPFRCTVTCACSSNLIFAHYTPRKSINVLKHLNDLCFFFSKLKHPSFGNICSPWENLKCIVVAVDARCVCASGVGGWQYTTSREAPCGLAVLWGRCHIKVVNSLFKTFRIFIFKF